MPLWKRKWSIPNLQCPFISYVRDTALWTSPQSISHVKSAEKVSVKEVFSTNTSDSTTRKTSQTVLYVEENFLLSSCWRATLQGLIQMWSVTYVTKLWRKEGWVGTYKHTRTQNLSVKRVIMFTTGETSWKSIRPLVEQTWCELEKPQQMNTNVMHVRKCSHRIVISFSTNEHKGSVNYLW